MQPIDNIGFLLQRLAFCLARQSDQVLQEQLGIGLSQFKILMVLQWKPNVQQKKIADGLGQTEAAISRQIKLLQKSGLLNITISPENRREHIARLTPKGVRMTDKALEVLNNYHAPMFERLSEKQKTQLLESLNIMYDHACYGEKLRHDLFK
jgi:DNA-binding MarR family transcriptional regulator